MQQQGDVVLEARGLTKAFQGFTAVNNVDLKVRRGTIHTLIGPNGAGKTTCFNMLSRFLAPTRGTIHYQGRDITHASPAAVSRLGLVRSFQISAVFPHLSCLENVRIGLQRRRGRSFDFWASARALRQYEAQAHELLATVGLEARCHDRAADLSYGQKRALELAATLSVDPVVMLLDEPTAGMGREELGRIAALIRTAAKDRTVVMVEHNLNLIAELSDCVTVLARGEVIAQGSYQEVAAHPQVIQAYIGVDHG